MSYPILPDPTVQHNSHDAQPDMLRAALWYAKRGFAVFPLHTPLFDHPQGHTCTCESYRHSDLCKERDKERALKGKKPLYLQHDQHCDEPGKHPRGVESWTKDSTTDPILIGIWWRRYPTANIAIDCGKSGILVLDADTYKDNYAGDELNVDENTVTSLTGGGGDHLWYRLPEGKTWGNATGTLPDGIDVRGAGGFIVAPPSLHKSGRRYQFELGYGPTEIDIGNVSPALADILDAAQTTKTTRYTTSGARWDGTPTTTPADLASFRLSDDILSTIADPPARGQRSEADMKVVVALCYAGATDDDILAIFQHNPIGTAGKYAERGLDYLDRTVTAARAYVEAHPPPQAIRQIVDAVAVGVRSLNFANLVPEELQSSAGYRTGDTDAMTADAGMRILSDAGKLEARISFLRLSELTGLSVNTCKAAMKRLTWLFEPVTQQRNGEATIYRLNTSCVDCKVYTVAHCGNTLQSTQLPLRTHNGHDAFVRSMTPMTPEELDERILAHEEKRLDALWHNKHELATGAPQELVNVPGPLDPKRYKARLAADLPSAGPAVLRAIDVITMHGAMTRSELGAWLHKKKSGISRLVRRGLELGLLVDEGGTVDIAPHWAALADAFAPYMPTAGNQARRKLEAADSRMRFCDNALQNGNLADEERNALHRRWDRAAKQKQDIAEREAPDLSTRNADVAAPGLWDYITAQRLHDRHADARIDMAEQQRAGQWRLVAEIQRMRRDGVTKHDAARMLEIGGWMRREVWAAMSSAWPQAVTA